MSCTAVRYSLRFASCFVFGIVAIALTSPAQAAVYGPSLYKGLLFEQTSHSQPITPVGYAGILEVLKDNPADFFNVSINTSSSPEPYALVATPGESRYWIPNLDLFPDSRQSHTYQRTVSTAEELDVLFPTAPARYRETLLRETSPGTYTYSFSELTPSYDQNYFMAAPYVTGGTYDSLQGLDTSETLVMQWFNPRPTIDLGPGGGGIWGGGGAEVRRAIDGTLVEGAVRGQTLFGSSLEPGTDYILTILSTQYVSGDFEEFFSQTSIPFTTAAVPEPSSLLLLGLGGVAMVVAARRKLRR